MGVCPVYAVTRREGGVARGKLMLIKENHQPGTTFGKKYEFFLSACLLCGSCQQGCPNEVDTPGIIQAARAELAAQKKSSLIQRLVYKLLPTRKMLPGLIRGARASRTLWAARIPLESGLHIRFLRGPQGQKRRIPELANPFYLDGKVPNSWTGKGLRVALFVGCVSNYLRPQAAQSVVLALNRLGASVKVPVGQGCCGLPAFGAGENQVVKRLFFRNVAAFIPPGGQWPDIITTPCASCAFMLKKQIPKMMIEDTSFGNRAELFAKRIVPFSQLWVQLQGSKSFEPSMSPGRVTKISYHDPCHLSRGFGEKDAPRHLLGSLNKATFVEMGHPCKCCGHGGNFNLSHYGFSLAIAKPKVENFIQSGADVLATECSGCLLQLSDAISQAQYKLEVITTAEAVVRYGK